MVKRRWAATALGATVIAASLAFAPTAGADESSYLYDLRYDNAFTGINATMLYWGYAVCADRSLGVRMSTSIDNIYYQTQLNSRDDAVYLYFAAVRHLCVPVWTPPSDV